MEMEMEYGMNDILKNRILEKEDDGKRKEGKGKECQVHLLLVLSVSSTEKGSPVSFMVIESVI
ncbi:hypothetical protein BOTCAL_0001g00750 [Botryotinia calthae]|uniref:Uncharacterized protein n=1 Tax=Botryotinia calthae TaxID=38488 RepID=A0A4Y8DKE0_9HELO|nr:hypothetical protein BOTCAL_0001g00750 [Botryotinia calthae]